MARPRQVSDEEILTATRDVVLREGAQVSTTVIAKSLGVSQAALFKRFGTKDALLLRALLPSEPTAWAEKFADGPDERPIDVQLVEIGTEFQAVYNRVLPCMLALKNSGIDPSKAMQQFAVPPPVVIRLAIVGWLSRAAAAGRIRNADTEAVAQTLMGAIASRTMLGHVLGDAAQFHDTDEEYITGVIDTLWNGLAPGANR